MRKLLYFLVSASMAGSVIVGTASTASAATAFDYCLGLGGRVVTKINPPQGTVSICEGGELDGTVLSVNR